MADADRWGVTDGALQHASKGFFSVVGVRPPAAQPTLFLYQPQGALTGVLTARVDGQRRFLLQGRAEPGCLGEAQFGPTVQSTPANYERRHGGASTPYVKPFIEFAPDVRILEDSVQLDLGARYWCKAKRSLLIEVAGADPAPETFAWATPSAIGDALGLSAFMNIDLRSIIAVAPWSADEDDGELTPRSDSVRRSLRAPIRDDVVGAVVGALARRRTGGAAGAFVPLDSLNDWATTEWGLAERVPRQGFSIDFFEVEARFREVERWVQPLLNSVSQGRAVLACREHDDALEVFVRVLSEPGLVTAAALAPSLLVYPGQAPATADWLEADPVVWSSTEESDEGGRFFQDVSRYQLVRVDDHLQPDASDGFWLRVSELKLFLRMSNVCSIQLRGLASQLLAAA